MKYFSKSFGPLPDMTVRSVGYGAGMKDLPVPNLLRVFIGEDDAREGYDTVLSLETNIDDMNPEFYQHVFERLLDAGALDVFTTPVIMKKGPSRHPAHGAGPGGAARGPDAKSSSRRPPPPASARAGLSGRSLTGRCAR